ncbi:unnamed protein product [Chondrus crispus]|uniref:Uncharacterized protein n=1 Tax=Chondrus crispus TaxID=2769 RepID=R7QK35_CHOCR|nr:unnamed protein product [Chondrus crispus]CDF37770.1 unnamed protein product [Chondrus crispus]|eukprot:XP_005717641.1 unnamed protein product [Chondrus crispus]
MRSPSSTFVAFAEYSIKCERRLLPPCSDDTEVVPEEVSFLPSPTMTTCCKPQRGVRVAAGGEHGPVTVRFAAEYSDGLPGRHRPHQASRPPDKKTARWVRGRPAGARDQNGRARPPVARQGLPARLLQIQAPF